MFTLATSYPQRLPHGLVTVEIVDKSLFNEELVKCSRECLVCLEVAGKAVILGVFPVSNELVESVGPDG